MNAIFAVSRDVLGPPALKLVVVEGGLYHGEDDLVAITVI
jgi:hypothetical protein